MKKNILSAVVAAAALFGAYTAQQANEGVMSDLLMENIDFLAEGEPGDYGTGKYYTWGSRTHFKTYSSHPKKLIAEGDHYSCNERSETSNCSHYALCTHYTYHRDEQISKLNAENGGCGN